VAIVVYDPDCGFCRFSLALLLIWDRPERERREAVRRGRPSPPHRRSRWGGSATPGALRPLPLGSPEADRLLADLGPEERAASWHLVLDQGAAPGPPRFSAGAAPGPPRFSAGAALAPALSLLPGGRVPASLFARFPRAAERGYRWVADHRGTLGRLVPARAKPWADRVIAAHGGPPAPQ